MRLTDRRCKFVNIVNVMSRDVDHCKGAVQWLSRRSSPARASAASATPLGLTQTAMAEGLGISPSYLNLIERNQRPLTVQLILKLASVYKIDPHELQGEAGGSVAALQGGVCRSAAGRRAAGRPGTDRARGGRAQCRRRPCIKLFRAYREQAERLSDLTRLLARRGAGDDAVGRAAADRRGARGFRASPQPFCRASRRRRKRSRAELGPWRRSVRGAQGMAAQASMASSCGCCRSHTMPNWRRRYDRHSQRLFLSERLSRLRPVARDRDGGLPHPHARCAGRCRGRCAEARLGRSAAARPLRACPLCGAWR